MCVLGGGLLVCVLGGGPLGAPVFPPLVFVAHLWVPFVIIWFVLCLGSIFMLLLLIWIRPGKSIWRVNLVIMMSKTEPQGWVSEGFTRWFGGNGRPHGTGWVACGRHWVVGCISLGESPRYNVAHFGQMGVRSFADSPPSIVCKGQRSDRFPIWQQSSSGRTPLPLPPSL